MLAGWLPPSPDTTLSVVDDGLLHGVHDLRVALDHHDDGLGAQAQLVVERVRGDLPALREIWGLRARLLGGQAQHVRAVLHSGGLGGELGHVGRANGPLEREVDIIRSRSRWSCC